jgi:predicted RNA binding protein YcfA (HicA-like mRNA interferase family)
MSKLPRVTGQAAIRVFCDAGFEVIRITGSHHILRREGHPYHLTVPVHGNARLKPGTLRSLIRSAGMTVDEFNRRLG